MTFILNNTNNINSNIPPTPEISSFPFSLCHCLVTHLSASDSYTIMALYKSTYLLTNWKTELNHVSATGNVINVSV